MSNKGNIITINNINKIIGNSTCKDFYWHVLNVQTHTPTAVHISVPNARLKQSTLQNRGSNIWNNLTSIV